MLFGVVWKTRASRISPIPLCDALATCWLCLSLPLQMVKAKGTKAGLAAAAAATSPASGLPTTPRRGGATTSSTANHNNTSVRTSSLDSP